MPTAGPEDGVSRLQPLLEALSPWPLRMPEPTISTAGLVPACRTLDCVSVFSLTVDDAMTALRTIAGPDDADP